MSNELHFILAAPEKDFPEDPGEEDLKGEDEGGDAKAGNNHHERGDQVLNNQDLKLVFDETKFIFVFVSGIFIKKPFMILCIRFFA